MKKTFYILTFIFLMMFCKQKTNKSELKTDNLNESVLEQDSIICIQQSEKGIKFETCLKKYDFFVLKSSNGNTLYRNDNNPSEFILKDFNEDGFSDIELHFITNVPDVNEILIFNPISKTFTEIENFWEFPAAKKIRKVNLYYSYQRSGCADSNWDSDLFYLKENKAVKIGNIQVIECNNESVNGIYFYIVNGNKKKLLKYISIEHKNFENKWEFIEKYWTKNYKKFE